MSDLVEPLRRPKNDLDCAIYIKWIGIPHEPHARLGAIHRPQIYKFRLIGASLEVDWRLFGLSLDF